MDGAFAQKRQEKISGSIGVALKWGEQTFYRDTRLTTFELQVSFVSECRAPMRVSRFQFVIACLLVVAVLAVCVAPSVDLDPTTLGLQQTASMAMMALAAGTVLISALILRWDSLHEAQSHLAAFPFPSLLDLICSRLC